MNLQTQDLASINLRKRPPIYPLDVRKELYRNSCFPYCISQWNNLDSRIKNLPSIATFKRAILDFISPVPTLIFKINRLLGFVSLTRLRIGFSHLRKHKFRHCFLDIADPICIVALILVKTLNTTFSIALISLINAPFCLMTFET